MDSSRHTSSYSSRPAITWVPTHTCFYRGSNGCRFRKIHWNVHSWGRDRIHSKTIWFPTNPNMSDRRSSSYEKKSMRLVLNQITLEDMVECQGITCDVIQRIYWVGDNSPSSVGTSGVEQRKHKFVTQFKHFLTIEHTTRNKDHRSRKYFSWSWIQRIERHQDF